MYSLYGDLKATKDGGEGEDRGKVEGGKGGSQPGRPGLKAGSSMAWARSSNKLFAQPTHLLMKKKNLEPGSTERRPPGMPMKRAPAPQPISAATDATAREPVVEAKQALNPVEVVDHARGASAVEDIYDPLKPNDYDAVLDERQRRQLDASESDRRGWMRSEDEEDSSVAENRADRRKERLSLLAPGGDSVAGGEDDQRVEPSHEHGETDRHGALKVSGEEAHARRAQLRMSGEEAHARRAQLRVSGEDAYMLRAQKKPRREGTSPPPLSSTGDGPAASPFPPPPSAPVAKSGESIAAMMMAKMGWKEGSGLGKDAQGITKALHASSSKGRMGIGTGGGGGGDHPSDRGRAAPLVEHTSKKVGVNSRVLLLTNMVGPGEVDEELEAETAEECTKYGRVDGCVVYEVTDEDVKPEYAVRIFVKFAEHEVSNVFQAAVKIARGWKLAPRAGRSV